MTCIIAFLKSAAVFPIMLVHIVQHNKISKRAFIANLNFQLVPKIVPSNYY